MYSVYWMSVTNSLFLPFIVFISFHEHDSISYMYLRFAYQMKVRFRSVNVFAINVLYNQSFIKYLQDKLLMFVKAFSTVIGTWQQLTSSRRMQDRPFPASTNPSSRPNSKYPYSATDSTQPYATCRLSTLKMLVSTWVLDS